MLKSIRIILWAVIAVAAVSSAAYFYLVGKIPWRWRRQRSAGRSSLPPRQAIRSTARS
jgi:hypothetical protein